MGRIALLSEALINKIAAGEVVERPASAVKELCENALDAGAAVIRVTLREGGLGAITVADDGVGMSREDAILCLSRHATSKLRDFEGLFQISTKGFRGEAVPAIAAVSRFRLTTCERGAAIGTRIEVEGEGPLAISEAPPLPGTRIELTDLFFNTPARRKFVRREQTELSHCVESVLRLALAHPEVGFFVEHEGRSLLASPACADDPRERIAAALGSEVHPHLLPVEDRRLGLRVSGHVASPELTLPTARGLYTFVNRRYVRDRGLNHAVQRAFQDTLPPGRQPVAVIFVELDPQAVDVNVHPQKLEVRFADGRGVYDAVLAAVSSALRAAPWLADQAAQLPSGLLAEAHYAQAVDRFLARAPMVAESGPAPLSQESSARPGLNQAPPPGFFSSLRALGLLARRFVICEGRGGTLLVLDPHAAIERVRLTELRRARRVPRSTQASLFSATVELPEEEASAIGPRLVGLAGLGIDVEPFGGRTFRVTALPAGLEQADLVSLFTELLPELAADGSPGDEASLEAAMRVLACHAAALEGRELGAEELRTLFAALEVADFETSALHARIVVSEVPLLELERRAREN